VAGICYVAPDVEIPSPRGASTHVVELSAALQSLGTDVHVVCLRSPGQLKTETIRGVTFHRVYRAPGGLAVFRKRTSIGGRGRSPDSFLSRSYRFYLQTVNALRVGLKTSKLVRDFKLVGILERETAFGAGALASLFTGRPMLLEIIGPKTSPLSVRRCSHLFAYSEAMVPVGGRWKAEYVEAAVNTEIFKDDPVAARTIKAKYGLERSIVVGYVGTFQSFHGVNDLLDAAKLVRVSLPTVKLLLVGPRSAGAIAYAKKLGLQNTAVFTGPVPYEQIPALINAADILVAPYNILGSERDVQGIGSPLKVLEYMAVGKATIGSSLPQVQSMISDRTTGLIFPQGDARALADKIVSLAMNEDERIRLGTNASRTAKERYSWRHLAEKFGTAMARARLKAGE